MIFACTRLINPTRNFAAETRKDLKLLGFIVTYSAAARGGVIRTYDQQNHHFHLSAWQEKTLPEPEQHVEFIFRGNRIAEVKMARQVEKSMLARV